MAPQEFFALLAAMLIPAFMLTYLVSRFFRLKEKRLDMEAGLAAEKAAQYAASNARLEARVCVLEKIVTDGGYSLTHEIEALRETPGLPGGKGGVQ